MAEELKDASAPAAPTAPTAPPPFLNYRLGSQACLHVVVVVVGNRDAPTTFVSEKVGEGRGRGRCMGALNLVMSSNRGKL